MLKISIGSNVDVGIAFFEKVSSPIERIIKGQLYSNVFILYSAKNNFSEISLTEIKIIIDVDFL